MAIPPFGSPPTPSATTIKQGKVKLAGDLTGTADLPVLASIVAGTTVGSATQIPIVTFDNKGRITGTTTATPSAPAQRTFGYWIG